jgi:thioredoxin-like negative regulator of GroEL
MTAVPREAATADRAVPGTERPKLVFVFSSTSGSSRKAEAFLAQVLQHRGNHATFDVIRLDSGRRPDLVERLRVSRVPALLVLEGGTVQAALSELNGCKPIADLLSPWLK